MGRDVALLLSRLQVTASKRWHRSGTFGRGLIVGGDAKIEIMRLEMNMSPLTCSEGRPASFPERGCRAGLRANKNLGEL